jgi:GTP-binding protein Era
VSGGTRAGVVAVVGAPNAGKSTLVNALVGAKVSIVSRKVQTTRTRIMGIAMRDLPDGGRAQILFLDTPGIFRTQKRRLERAMVAAAWRGAEEGDRTLLVIDAVRGLSDDVRSILERLASRRGPCVLVVNKIDLLPRAQLLALVAAANQALPFERTFLVSALKGDGLGDLLDYVATQAVPGPFLFPEDQTTDMPMRQLAAEIVREQVFEQLHEELPYEIAVETEGWQQRKDGSARVECTIHVARENQRSIVLGKGGVKIKSIGARARRELSDIVGHPVHLFLHVKVSTNWADDRSRYVAWGLEYDA